jgi:hypothetical protein
MAATRKMGGGSSSFLFCFSLLLLLSIFFCSRFLLSSLDSVCFSSSPLVSFFSISSLFFPFLFFILSLFYSFFFFLYLFYFISFFLFCFHFFLFFSRPIPLVLFRPLVFIRGKRRERANLPLSIHGAG